MKPKKLCSVCGEPMPRKNKFYCSNACQGVGTKGKVLPYMVGRVAWNGDMTAKTDPRISSGIGTRGAIVVDADTLRQLYVEENLTASVIGERYGVSKASIQRMVNAYGLEHKRQPHEDLTPELVRRLYLEGKSFTDIAREYECSPSWVNKLGLMNEGLTGRTQRNHANIIPDAETLRRLYCDEWLSCEAIGEQLGVAHASIRRWLKKFGIPIRKISVARRSKGWQEPDAAVIVHLYEAEGMSSETIGEMLGVRGDYVTKLLRLHGIAVRQSGYAHIPHYTAKDGHRVKSGLELQVDNWLFAHGIDHIYEAPVPNTLYKSDFLVGDIYIEVWGLLGYKPYDEKYQKKLEAYQQQGLALISVFPRDFPNLDVLAENLL